MPPKRAGPSLEISFFAHVTEDHEKVIRAAKNLLTVEVSRDIVFHQSQMKGYFGNPITIYRCKVQGEGKINAILGSISARLGEIEKEGLLREIDRHLDEARNLYLRFDKQAACLDSVKLSLSDPIHMRLRLPAVRGSRKELLEVLRNVGLLPSEA